VVGRVEGSVRDRQRVEIEVKKHRGLELAVHGRVLEAFVMQR
jgi:hypothetical protein